MDLRLLFPSTIDRLSQERWLHKTGQPFCPTCSLIEVKSLLIVLGWDNLQSSLSWKASQKRRSIPPIHRPKVPPAFLTRILGVHKQGSHEVDGHPSEKTASSLMSAAPPVVLECVSSLCTEKSRKAAVRRSDDIVPFAHHDEESFCMARPVRRTQARQNLSVVVFISPAQCKSAERMYGICSIVHPPLVERHGNIVASVQETRPKQWTRSDV